MKARTLNPYFVVLAHDGDLHPSIADLVAAADFAGTRRGK